MNRVLFGLFITIILLISVILLLSIINNRESFASKSKTKRVVNVSRPAARRPAPSIAALVVTAVIKNNTNLLCRAQGNECSGDIDCCSKKCVLQKLGLSFKRGSRTSKKCK